MTDDEAIRARPDYVRIPFAILLACVVTSIATFAWSGVVGDGAVRGIGSYVGGFLLFGLAPALTAGFLRGSRWWARILFSLAGLWVWMFWLFIVVIPVARLLDW